MRRRRSRRPGRATRWPCPPCSGGQDLEKKLLGRSIEQKGKIGLFLTLSLAHDLLPIPAVSAMRLSVGLHSRAPTAVVGLDLAVTVVQI